MSDSTTITFDNNVFLKSFLEGTLGVDGYQAFFATLQKDEKLQNAVVGRTLWAWVQTLSASESNFNGFLPGMSGLCSLTKSEDRIYDGYISVNDQLYKFTKATEPELAATLGLALGANHLEVPAGVRSNILSKLGKSVDLLVKSRYLNAATRSGPRGNLAKSDPELIQAKEISKKILDPSAGYKLETTHHDLGDGKRMTRVNTFSPDGEHVGAASFLHVGNSLVPGTVVVADEHQRRGIASAMYSHVQNATKKVIKPSSNQTPEGQALWSGNAVNPQFGNQVSKNLSVIERDFLRGYFGVIASGLNKTEVEVLNKTLDECGLIKALPRSLEENKANAQFHENSKQVIEDQFLEQGAKKEVVNPIPVGPEDRLMNDKLVETLKDKAQATPPAVAENKGVINAMDNSVKYRRGLTRQGIISPSQPAATYRQPWQPFDVNPTGGNYGDLNNDVHVDKRFWNAIKDELGFDRTHEHNGPQLSDETVNALAGFNKSDTPVNPQLHSTLEGFMGGLKTLPQGPARGKFITAHLNHAPFIAALQNHPQGPKMLATLNAYVNSKTNAGPQGPTKVVVKKELEKGAPPESVAENEAAEKFHHDSQKVIEDQFLEQGGKRTEHTDNQVAKLSNRDKFSYYMDALDPERQHVIDPVLNNTKSNIYNGIREARKYNFQNNRVSAGIEPDSAVHSAPSEINPAWGSDRHFWEMVDQEAKINKKRLEKSWPVGATETQDSVDNQANAAAHSVMEDAILEQGGEKKEIKPKQVLNSLVNKRDALIQQHRVGLPEHRHDPQRHSNHNWLWYSQSRAQQRDPEEEAYGRNGVDEAAYVRISDARFANRMQGVPTYDNDVEVAPAIPDGGYHIAGNTGGYDISPYENGPHQRGTEKQFWDAVNKEVGLTKALNKALPKDDKENLENQQGFNLDQPVQMDNYSEKTGVVNPNPQVTTTEELPDIIQRSAMDYEDDPTVNRLNEARENQYNWRMANHSNPNTFPVKEPVAPYLPHIPNYGSDLSLDLEKQFWQQVANDVGLNKTDLMPGGKGDNKKDSSFDSTQLSIGVKKEMEEHGLDEVRAKEIAKDHLTEDPHYYSSMKKALPKDDKENQDNIEANAVLQDHIMGNGRVVSQNEVSQGLSEAENQVDEYSNGFNQASEESTSYRHNMLHHSSDDPEFLDRGLTPKNPSATIGGAARAYSDYLGTGLWSLDQKNERLFWRAITNEVNKGALGKAELEKTWPKDDTENKANADAHLVLQDKILENSKGVVDHDGRQALNNIENHPTAVTSKFTKPNTRPSKTLLAARERREQIMQERWEKALPYAREGSFDEPGFLGNREIYDKENKKYYTRTPDWRLNDSGEPNKDYATGSTNAFWREVDLNSGIEDPTLTPHGYDFSRYLHNANKAKGHKMYVVPSKNPDGSVEGITVNVHDQDGNIIRSRNDEWNYSNRANNSLPQAIHPAAGVMEKLGPDKAASAFMAWLEQSREANSPRSIAMANSNATAIPTKEQMQEQAKSINKK